MTVIAWDGKTLAADKRACLGGLIRTTTKIFRAFDPVTSDGVLVGYGGDAACGEELLAWFKRGAKPEEYPPLRKPEDWARLLVIGRGGTICFYENTPYPVKFARGQAFAIGSGRDFALAAMQCGKTAQEAVEVATVFDNGCGNGVDTLEFL